MAQIAVPAPTQRATTATAPKISQAEKKLTPIQSLFAGGLAGATEACITYPFEYAKTRSQLESRPGLATGSSNPFSLLRHTISNEGFSALYTGCGTLAAGTALKAGVRFMTFDTIKAQLADSQGRLSTSNGILR